MVELSTPARDMTGAEIFLVQRSDDGFEERLMSKLPQVFFGLLKSRLGDFVFCCCCCCCCCCESRWLKSAGVAVEKSMLLTFVASALMLARFIVGGGVGGKKMVESRLIILFLICDLFLNRPEFDTCKFLVLGSDISDFS